MIYPPRTLSEDQEHAKALAQQIFDRIGGVIEWLSIIAALLVVLLITLWWKL